jgi:hypothetical protein
VGVFEGDDDLTKTSEFEMRDKCLLSYAKGLKKTYRHVIMNTCHGLQEVTGQNGGHMKHILTEKMYTGV